MNGIDSLKTGEDVLRFVHTIPGCSKSSVAAYYNETIQVADSLHTRSWVKTDIDQNGETDLLLFRFDALPDICALLSFNGGYVKINADYWCKYQFMYPVVKTIGQQPVILLYNQDQTGYDDRAKHFTYTKISCDTLMVRDTLFLSYAKPSARNRVESIELENDGVCEGTCPRIAIHIDARTLANTCRKDEPWDHDVESYTGELSAAQVKRLLGILEQSGFPAMKEKYSVGCSDATTTTLTIMYDGGKKKVISDYGGSGNFTLSAFYKIAFDVKWTKN